MYPGCGCVMVAKDTYCVHKLVHVEDLHISQFMKNCGVEVFKDVCLYILYTRLFDVWCTPIEYWFNWYLS